LYRTYNGQARRLSVTVNKPILLLVRHKHAINNYFTTLMRSTAANAVQLSLDINIIIYDVSYNDR